MNGSAFLLVVVGLLLFYVVISDKFYCLQGAFNCLVFGERQDGGNVSAPGAPATPKLQNLPIIPAPVPNIRTTLGI